MNYTIYNNITSTLSIGDTLSTSNLNYLNLDEWVTNIQLSAQNFWIPLMNFYKSISTELKNNFIIAQTNKFKWDSFSTVVETNSTKWIEPLVVVYPNILTTEDLNSDQSIKTIKYNQITDWFNTNFPIVVQNSTLYVENQKAYVYILKQQYGDNINTIRLLQNNGSCSTSDIDVCTRCETKYQGYVWCSNGDFQCNGKAACTQCNTLNCYYDQTGTDFYNPIIQAFLNINYQDIYELSDIDCLKFEIQNCQWQYITQI